MPSFLLIIFFIAFGNNSCFAQSDPFASTNTSVDAAALSPSELPSFDEYRESPENIKVLAITPSEFVHAQAASRERIMVLDARSEMAFNMSHLQGAKHCGFNDFSTEKVWMLNRKARVIVYSYTNSQSILIAQYLRLMGFYDVQILDGGIIAWKNNNQDIVDLTSLSTDKVHVGPKDNMRLLKHGRGFHY